MQYALIWMALILFGCVSDNPMPDQHPCLIVKKACIGKPYEECICVSYTLVDKTKLIYRADRNSDGTPVTKLLVDIDAEYVTPAGEFARTINWGRNELANDQ